MTQEPQDLGPMDLEEIIVDMAMGFAAGQMVENVPAAFLKSKLAQWSASIRHHARERNEIVEELKVWRALQECPKCGYPLSEDAP